MAKFTDVEKHLSTNPAFIGELLANPKNALKKARLEIDNQEDARRLEVFVRLTKLNLNAAANLTNFKTSMKADWGIGMGCCNSKKLAALNVDRLGD
ncbi:MAG: hypothetical protein H6566_18440 [Lewinellaceae bacterium]|nr:hypothetical protein [Lewinellaceae bacterium]